MPIKSKINSLHLLSDIKSVLNKLNKEENAV